MATLVFDRSRRQGRPTQVIQAPESGPKASCQAGSRDWKNSSGWKKEWRRRALRRRRARRRRRTEEGEGEEGEGEGMMDEAGGERESSRAGQASHE